MKNTFFSIAVAAATVGAFVGANSLTADAKPAPKVQTAKVIIDGTYKPGTVNVKAGVPTKLSFTLKSDSGCGNTVVIPTLKKKFDLKVGETKTVSFTPKKNQVLAFACSMKMLNGKVIAR